MQRKQWTPHQDQILKTLYEKVKLNKWSLIARQMVQQYHLPPRTGKQCRQRYNNHLNPFFAKEAWTSDEEQKLFRLHDQLGNKWAIIAAQIGGRTDNSVKNHFYAKLRKSMRRINKLIQERFKKDLRAININVLYKIVQASQEKFKKEPMCDLQTSEYSCCLKNRILQIPEYDSTALQNEELRTLVEEIKQFGKKYKRKPKQLRRIPTKSEHQSINSPIASDPSEEDPEDSNDEIIRPEVIMKSVKDVQDVQEQKPKLRSATLKVNLEELNDHSQGEAQDIMKDVMFENESNQLFRLPFASNRNNQSSQNMSNCSARHEEFLEDSGFPYDIPPMVMRGSLKRSQKQQNDDHFFHQ